MKKGLNISTMLFQLGDCKIEITKGMFSLVFENEKDFYILYRNGLNALQFFIDKESYREALEKQLKGII